MKRLILFALLNVAINTYGGLAQGSTPSPLASTSGPAASGCAEKVDSIAIGNVVTIYKANMNLPGGLEKFLQPDNYVTQIQNATKAALTNCAIGSAVQNRTDQ